MSERTFNVLFLCTENAVQSIIAEAILARDGQGVFQAFSAGSRPRRAVDRYVLDVLTDMRHDVSHLSPKSWNVFADPGAPMLDFVFTVCNSVATEPCPEWPGQPVSAHWGIPDPTDVVGSESDKKLAYAETYRIISERIANFVLLPVDCLDKLHPKIAPYSLSP